MQRIGYPQGRNQAEKPKWGHQSNLEMHNSRKPLPLPHLEGQREDVESQGCKVI